MLNFFKTYQILSERFFDEDDSVITKNGVVITRNTYTGERKFQYNGYTAFEREIKEEDKHWTDIEIISPDNSPISITGELYTSLLYLPRNDSGLDPAKFKAWVDSQM